MTQPKHKRRATWILRGTLFLFLLGLVFILGSINVPFLQPDEPTEFVLLYFLSTLVFLALVIYGLVLVRYLVRLYAERQRHELGSHFKTKMVVGALGLSLLPVLAQFFVSYTLVNRTLTKWFPRPLENVRDDALYIVRHMLQQEEERAREAAQKMAQDPALHEALARNDLSDAHRVVSRIAAERRLHWAAVTGPSGKALVEFHPSGEAGFLAEWPRIHGPPTALAYTTTEEIRGTTYSFARVRLETSDGQTFGAILVAHPVDRTLLTKRDEILAESRNYDLLTKDQKAYRWQAPMILLLVTTLILLASTWLALFLAKEVTVPIQALAVATEEVSRGNFHYRIDVPARDELGTLVESFNAMTAQLGESRRHLEQALAELDRRRQLMETILENIPTGVITLTPDLQLLRVNASAQALLNCPATGELALRDLLPAEAAEACAELFPRADRTGVVSAQIDISLPDRIAHTAVIVSALRRGGEHQGYVLVLDDLSDLLKAQKAAAWQEVAQRIAHEIKNPLTPIQLSADRIRRYVQRETDPDRKENARLQALILECACTIGEEVHSLKTLVDEFSHFARFPVVKPVPTQLNQIVESTLALYPENRNGIRLRTELADGLPPVAADPELLRRVVTNLLRNATDALLEDPAGEKEILIGTRYLQGSRTVELTVADTGPGISPKHKERLFLPFFSTKTDGMGLGLAIVSRIVSEHRGTIRVEDNHPRGTRFVVELPTQPKAAAA